MRLTKGALVSLRRPLAFLGSSESISQTGKRDKNALTTVSTCQCGGKAHIQAIVAPLGCTDVSAPRVLRDPSSKGRQAGGSDAVDALSSFSGSTCPSRAASA